jgi:hypothetical protein
MKIPCPACDCIFFTPAPGGKICVSCKTFTACLPVAADITFSKPQEKCKEDPPEPIEKEEQSAAILRCNKFLLRFKGYIKYELSTARTMLDIYNELSTKYKECPSKSWLTKHYKLSCQKSTENTRDDAKLYRLGAA